MRIKNLQINGFGNLENKKIDLEPGLNIISGKNESGKSTITDFIKSIFYGVNRNKDGNKFSEYEKFRPWKDIDFSGKVTYEYNGSEYTVYRDFNRNNSKVYDKDGIDITKEFNKDRARGVEIGLAHLKLDEATFKSSFLIKQANVAVEPGEQKAVIQKLTNMIQTGDEGMSYEKTKSRLEKMLLDEVGTERTHNKPKNIVNDEIVFNERRKHELIHNKERCLEIENEIKQIRNKKEKANKDYEATKSVYDVKYKYKTMLEEKQSAFEAAKKLMEKEREEASSKKKKQMIQGAIILSLLFVIIIAYLVFTKRYELSIAALAMGIAVILLYIKLESKEEVPISELNFDVTKEELNKKEQKELEDLEKQGVKNSLFSRKITDLKSLKDGYEKASKDLELDEHKLYIEMESLKFNVNKLNDVEENLQIAYNKRAEIEKLERTIKLAISTLDDSYQELRNELMPDIANLVRESVAKTTNGKYSNVVYNDNAGMFVENDNGELISIDKLSIGTIDQIYLGFRFAVTNRLENIPMILDESFVYCDDERLKNILETISRLAEEKQIIILSCSDREINLLEKMNAKYEKIIL